MADAGRDRDLDQGPRLNRVVEIVAERIDDRIGDDDRPREMDDGVDAVLAHDRAHEILIPHVADDERRLGRHHPPKASRQIVENHNLFAGLDELENHMAADVAGPARNQDSLFFDWRKERSQVAQAPKFNTAGIVLTRISRSNSIDQRRT